MSKIEVNHGLTAASIRSASFRESDHSIEIVWSTGAAVRRRGRDGNYFDEILSLDPAHVRLERLNAGAPFLNTHNDSNLSAVLGSVIPGSARIAAGKGVARVALSKAPADADHVLKIRDGVIRNISVGYAIHSVERIETDTAIPIMRVIDWEPLEISAVPVPADYGAGIVQSARTKPSRSTQADVRTIPRYSADAARARCIVKMQQRNLLRPTGALH